MIPLRLPLVELIGGVVPLIVGRGPSRKVSVAEYTTIALSGLDVSLIQKVWQLFTFLLLLITKGW